MTGAGSTARMDQRGSARGYLYALIGANLATVAVASLVLYWHDRADDTRWRILTEYHMGAAGQARLALTEIKLLRQSLITFERYAPMFEPGPATPGEIENLRLEASDRLNTIRLASQTIEALQIRFAEPGFAEATAWATDGVTRLAGLLRDETGSENFASGEIAAAARNLELRLEQLARLHLLAHDELAADEHVDQPAGYRYLLILLVALIAGGSVVSAIIVRRFKGATLAHGATVAALHESDALFKAIFDQAAVGIALMTPDGRYIQPNGKMCEIMGRTADELIGRPFRDITHPDDVESNLALLAKLQSGELSTFSMEKRYVRGDGDVFWASLTVSMIRGETGEPQCMIAVVQDIDARKRAQEALHESELLFRAIFDQAAVGIAVVAMDGRYMRVNQKLCNILGYTNEELVRMNFRDVTHPNSLADSLELGKVLEAGGDADRTWEKQYLRKDGSPVWADRALSLIRDEAGAPRFYVIIIQDIDARKQAEEALGRLNAELEDRVEERTAELHAAQEELVRSERLATLGQLTATVSHELRNPLGAMRTSVYIVEQVADMSDTRLARSIDRINRSIARCDNIIDEMLDFTRIRNLEPADTRIDRWLKTVLDEQPAPPGITVRRKLGAADAVVSVDANRLRRAIINVYENACQASAGPDGRRPANRKHRVTIATRIRKNRLEIVIADNGQGIPPETMPKIFEPLFSTKNFGVGLGLPTVRQIMEQHGGGVDVTSKSGKGTRFVLWVPLAPALEAVE